MSVNLTACPENSSFDQNPTGLADIYTEGVNIAVWQRDLPNTLQRAVSDILRSHTTLQLVCTVSAADCVKTLTDELGGTDSARILSEDIHNLVDMYCVLFELERVAIRLTKLDKAMCPKFHVDRVPARLVTTYCGNGTQWLDNTKADRSRLGKASAGLLDEASGIYRQASDISSLTAGDVALLKGESWIGNEGNGIVHRSPAVQENAERLVMTFDFTTDD